MSNTEIPIPRRYFDAFPYVENGWTVRQTFDRQTGDLVSTLASKPIDQDIVCQMPGETHHEKPGRIKQALTRLFNLDV
jgi:hypothetical protein